MTEEQVSNRLISHSPSGRKFWIGLLPVHLEFGKDLLLDLYGRFLVPHICVLCDCLDVKSMGVEEERKMVSYFP